jgi:F0F1-type ATP synthase assembly protein I
MEEKDTKRLRQPALEIGGLISSWIIAPIILALVLGKWLDNYFHTAPILFLSLAGFAFIISIFGIFKTVSKYAKKIESLSNKKDGNPNEPK